MSSDLAAFLLARVAEDEAAAVGAAEDHPVPWMADAPVPFIGGMLEDGEGFSVFTGTDYGPDACATAETVVQVARWDPARVLAECAAKRRIIDLHSPPKPYTTDDGFDVTVEPYQANQCRSCGYVESWKVRDYGPTYPCPTLHALAASYSAHPGFDASWGSL